MVVLLRFRLKRKPPPRIKCKFCTWSTTKKGPWAFDRLRIHIISKHSALVKNSINKLMDSVFPKARGISAEFQKQLEDSAFRRKKKSSVKVIKGGKS